MAAQIRQPAARRHGYVTRAQLLGCGMLAGTIARWTRSGRLITVHAGVYAVGYATTTPMPVTMAAALACGPAAGATHASATPLGGLTAFAPIPEVSAPTDRRRANIITHRSRLLVAQDLRRQSGVPTTSVPRTILDVAPRHTDEGLVRLIDDARHRGILGPDGLATLLAASRRIRGRVDPASNPTRSEFESRFLAVSPQPRPLCGRSRPGRRSTAAGYVTLRYPWEAVGAGQAATAREVRGVLRTRAPAGPSG